MPYIQKSHITLSVERVRFDELLAQARAGDPVARRELWESHKIRIYVKGDTLVDTMNKTAPRKG